MRVTGSCHCGRIAFAAEIESDHVRVCHCTDCQKLSGSAFRINVPVAPGGFMLTRGEPKLYVKRADSGKLSTHGFCSDCGSPIFSIAAGDPPRYSLRVGTLDRRAELRPARQIWCGSALPWAMDLRDLVQSGQQPVAR